MTSPNTRRFEVVMQWVGWERGNNLRRRKSTISVDANDATDARKQVLVAHRRLLNVEVTAVKEISHALQF